MDVPSDYVPQDYDIPYAPPDSGFGDYMRLNNLYEEIEQEIDQLREHEYRAAQFESEYRMKISTLTAKERMHGTPVTVISDLVRGDENIAKLKLEWKKAEADAKASSHLIFLKKDQSAMLTDAIKHDWYRPSNA